MKDNDIQEKLKDLKIYFPLYNILKKTALQTEEKQTEESESNWQDFK